MAGKYLIACDKFKGSLSSAEANAALAAGIHSVEPDAAIKCLSVSDGGQGFVEALQQIYELDIQNVLCLDARGKSRMGRLAWDLDSDTVYIESADAIGLPWLSPAERDPWLAHSEGLGWLIKFAIELEPAQIVIGLGGSATSDGGLGCLKALGFEPLDHQGIPLPGRGASLEVVAKVITPRAQATLPTLTLICDVDNPPTGPRGGVRVYTPQKGADPETAARLEIGMDNWLQVLEKQTGKVLQTLVGGGAAGCLSSGLHALLDAQLVSGSVWILDQLDFDSSLSTADIVISGEGAFDQSSLEGKLTGEILSRAHSQNKPAVIVSGQTPPAEIKTDPRTQNLSVYSLSERQSGTAQSAELSERTLFTIGVEIATSRQKQA